MRVAAFDDPCSDVSYSAREDFVVTIFATEHWRRCCAGGALGADEIAKSPKSLFGVGKWAILLRLVFAHPVFSRN